METTSQIQAKPLRFVTNYGAPHPKRRRIGAACLTCRKRKTACSGERPHCDTCKQNRLDCAGYAAESGTDAKSRQARTSPPRNVSVDDSIDPALKAISPIPRRQTPSIPHKSAGSPRLSSLSDPQRDSLFSGPRNRMPYFRWLGPTAIMPGFKQMVVKIKRHDSDRAASSADGMPPALSPPLNRASSETRLPVPGLPESEARTPLSLPFYDTSSVPPSELITHLAHTFFTHLGCNYPFLQRERFMRDLEEKQVDAILVDAVCALAARFSTHSLLRQSKDNKPAEYGQAFAQRAKSALPDTFACPSVAAVQAALLLAYNEFGESRDSGLWMYLGISIRLAQDLGMHTLQGLKYKGTSGLTPKMYKKHTDTRHLNHILPVRLTPKTTPAQEAGNVAEQEAAEQERVDTFWAVFFLDRVVSSGTGRRSTLRDKDIEVAFPPLDQEDDGSWPAPFPALIRIIHLYGRVADLLNGIKEPGDVTIDTSKRLASMENQVTSFYQGLSSKLHFVAESFQHYVKAGEGTNFVLLHFWFHLLIVLLHQPTLLTTFEGRMLQLFPNSQQLSMSSAKTIADILAYSQLVDAKASLGNPFTTQPIYIAACAFLRETAENSASSNVQSRASSPKADDKQKENGTTADKKAKHTLLAQAANQHYQLCYKALQSLETYWAGTKYILTVLDQKFEGVGDPLLYTAEEGESAMERPKPDPAFTTPGWRRNLSFGQSAPGLGNRFWDGAERQSENAIGWTLTGTTDSPSTNLAWHYASDNQRPPAQNLAAMRNGPRNVSRVPADNYGSNDVSDASLLLGLQHPYQPDVQHTTDIQHFQSGMEYSVQPPTTFANMSEYGGMFIESQDVEMSALGLDMMPWFDSTYGIDNTGLLNVYNAPVERRPSQQSRRRSQLHEQMDPGQHDT